MPHPLFKYFWLLINCYQKIIHSFSNALTIYLLLAIFMPALPLYASETCLTNKTLSIPREYQRVADATGGSVLRLEKGELSQLPFSLLIDVIPREHFFKLIKKFGLDEVVTLPIDSSVEQLRVHISAQQPMTFELRTPNDKVVPNKSFKDTSVKSYSSGCVVLIENPKPGIWTMHIRSSEKVSVDVQGKTLISFVSFNYVQLEDPLGQQGEFPVKRPEAGAFLDSVAVINSNNKIQHIEEFQIRSIDGTIVERITSKSEDKNSPFGSYRLAPSRVPKDEQRIYVVGVDNKGFHFQRMYSHFIKGQASTKENVDAEDEYGVTALFNAIYNNDMSKTQSLITAGANVNHRLKNGGTTLMYAINHLDCTILQLLLDQGADVNAIDKYSATAVFKATVAKNTQAVKMLLELGANPTIRDGSGYTAYQWAKKKELREILILLQPYLAGIPVDTLAPAINMQ